MHRRTTVVVRYTVTVEDKDLKRAAAAAQVLGYGFCDAGPIETVKRHLIAEGTDNVFPEDRYDHSEINIVREDP